MSGSYFLNGQPHGEQAQMLQEVRYQPGMLRPYLYKGRRYVTLNSGPMLTTNAQGKPCDPYRAPQVHLLDDLERKGFYSPVGNAASLTKEAWIQLDNVVRKEKRKRLRAIADLQSAGLTISGFNAMGKSTYEHQVMSDPGVAMVDMDIINDGRGDSPLVKIRSIPLPITYSMFQFSQRLEMISEGSGMPLRTTNAEWATRRVLETIEKTLIGEVTGITYGSVSTGPTAHDGSSRVYGYTNYTNRNTKTDLTLPTGANPDDTLQDVLEIMTTLKGDNFFGPYMIYHSPDYDAYMDQDYFINNTGIAQASGTSITLRNRLRAIDGIMDVRRLDWLDDTFTLIVVQMDSDTVMLIDGMAPSMVQWDTRGGMQKNFMVWAIEVPLLMATYSGNCGILHATTA